MTYYYDSDYSSGGVGTGGWVGIIIVAIAIKIGIISCIVYACRRRSYPYVVAPNTATVATVVNTNNQTNYPYMQQQMPVSYPPQYTTNPVANVPNYNPPAYPDTSPTAGLVQNQA